MVVIFLYMGKFLLLDLIKGVDMSEQIIFFIIFYLFIIFISYQVLLLLLHM